MIEEEALVTETVAIEVEETVLQVQSQEEEEQIVEEPAEEEVQPNVVTVEMSEEVTLVQEVVSEVTIAAPIAVPEQVPETIEDVPAPVQKAPEPISEQQGNNHCRSRPARVNVLDTALLLHLFHSPGWMFRCVFRRSLHKQASRVYIARAASVCASLFPRGRDFCL